MSGHFKFKKAKITKKTVIIIILLIITGLVGWFTPLVFHWFEQSKQEQFESKRQEAQNSRMFGSSDDAVKKTDDALNDPSLTSDQRYRLYIDRGSISYDKNDYTDAINYFEKAEQIKQDYEIADLLSRSWDKAGNKEKAIEYYKKFIELLPDLPLRNVYKEDAENAIKRLGGSL